MKRITDTTGWKNGFGFNSDVWTSPEGEKYAKCRNGEKPDLELVSSIESLPSLFVRRLDTSSKLRRYEKEQEQIERAKRARRRKARSQL